MYFIVTVKLPKDLTHNPRNKVKGRCRMYQNIACNDRTGEHHSILVESRAEVSTDRIQSMFTEKGYHVTRVERVEGVVQMIDIINEAAGIT